MFQESNYHPCHFEAQAFSHAVVGSCPVLGLHPGRSYHYLFGGLCHLSRRMVSRRIRPGKGVALSSGGLALVLVAVMALMAARQKRDREHQTIDNLLDTGCSVAKLLRSHLNKVGDVEDDEGVCSIGHMQKRISKQLHSVDSIQTPYGTLIQEMDVPCNGLPPLKMQYINPFALLYYCSTISLDFYNFMCQTIPEGGGRFVLYADEVSPSDGLKFEQNRQYNCIYWTFLDWPSWFISRMDIGWLPFGYLPCTAVKDGLTNWAKVMGRIMRVFFDPEGWHFENVGVRLCNNGVTRLIRARFGCFIADAKALAQICSLKSSSGTKPCPYCKNCLGHCDHFDHDYFVHVHSADVGRFDFHTPESFAEAVQLVKDAAATGNTRKLKEAEQEQGLIFDAESVAFDDAICQQANLPDSVYFDTMHNVCTSGGFGQYHINQFCRRMRQHGISGEHLDAWYACINTPRQGFGRLSKHWFSQRINDGGDGTHCKAYASEMLSVVSLLCCFADQELTPRGLMPEEVSCLKKLELMLDIVFSHNHEHAHLLNETTIAHHKEFVALYPECVKNKPHYQLHVAAAAARMKKMLTCFGAERKSKFTKEIAAHCFKKTTHTIASYELRRLLKAVQDPLAYSAEHLRGKLMGCPAEIATMLPAAWMIREVKLGKQLVTAKGSFSKGDVVIWFQNGTEILRAGRIQGFITGKGQHVVHNIASVAMYAHQDGYTWSTVDPPTVLVSASLLLITVAWHDDVEVPHRVRLLLPRVYR